MTKVILQGHIIVPAADLSQVMAALPNHIALTRAEQGCLVFEVTPDAQDRHRFQVYEEFVSQAAFEQHQRRAQASAWADVTKHVQRFYYITTEVAS